MDERFNNIAFSPADILLPKDADMTKWAVVACDQFTSQPEYWEKAEQIVGDAPSALNLILPEVYLNGEDVPQRIEGINSRMAEYLSKGVFKEYGDSLIYIERTQSDGRVRRGIVGKIDLEDYEFKPGNNALIRATEGTVLSRIPPRVKVRENADLELPHVMLLIDDPEKTVIEPLKEMTSESEKVYDFELMEGGGKIKGYLLGDDAKDSISKALKHLASQEVSDAKYGMAGAAPMLFAVGDGNHSLATAKQCYENIKKTVPESEWASLPARYALIEVVNLHDDALTFEPIHRTVFNADAGELLKAFTDTVSGSIIVEGASAEEVSKEPGKYLPDVPALDKEAQFITYCYSDKTGTIVVPRPEKQLAVGTLQAFLDEYLKDRESEIDYIHGDDTCVELGRREGNISFLLPAMGKQQLFKTVMADGVLPRKTFSMGHAQDKRYYIEARRIKR